MIAGQESTVHMNKKIDHSDIIIFFIESDFPVLKDSCSNVDWYLLGIELGINTDQLDAIERDVSQEACLKKMFHYWIANVETSWAKLVDALMSQSICEEELARKIAAKYPIE